MTDAPNDLKIPDYLELVDSSNNIISQTSKDKNLDNAKQQDTPDSSHQVNTGRPLPVVNGALGQKLPYYNVHNGSGDSKTNKPISANTRAAGKLPSYEFPSVQTSPEINSYSQLSSVLDDYDILAPVQSLPVVNMDKKQSQHNADVTSKKCFVVSVCCILVALLVVLAATLIAVLVSRDQIKYKMDLELSSLRKLQDKMSKNVMDSILTIVDNRQNAAPNLTVLYADSCYCLYRKQLNWKDAKDFCLAKGNGVHLAEIYKREENDFLMRVLQSLGTNKGIWLGGSDLDTEGTWVWNYTGKPIELFEPTQWLPNQPSSVSPFLTKEDCLDVYNWDVPTFKWNDNSCDIVQPFLCKSTLLQSKCFC